MAGPNDIDPYAPVPENPLAPPAEPWSWVPPEWGSQEYPQPPTQLQPGLGIPTSVVDAQAPGPEIEMPPDYVGTPTIGFPHVPIDAEPMFPPDAAPAPAVDAVSGPGPMVPTTAQPTPGELRSEALFEPKDPADEVVPYAAPLSPDARAKQFAAMSPEEQAKSEMAWTQQRDAEYGKRMSRLDLEDQQRSFENQTKILRARDEVHQQMVQLDADSKALAEQNIDPEHWWASRSTPQKISGYVAAIVGGLVQSRQGGANQGMAMIDRAIDQDIDAQKENLANKRAELARRGASIQQRQALDQDDYLLGEQFRIATYSRLQNQVAKDMQNYDPAGKNALELGKIYTSIGQRRAQAMQDLEDKTFKQKVDAIKADLDTQKTTAEIGKLRAETMKLQRGTGTGTAKANALENPLVAGLAPKDRERVVYSPDGKRIKLAASAAQAEELRGKIDGANDAIASTDSVMAALLNDPGLSSRIKAGVGLNPEDLAVIKSLLSTLKPKIGKFESDTQRLPLVEIHAIDAAIDDPSKFTSNTLAQIQALRKDMVDASVNRFKSQFGDLITKDSFGHAPQLAADPDAPQIVGHLTAPVVTGDAGIAKPDAANFAGELEELFRKHVETPTIAGKNNEGGVAQGQQDFQDELDKVEAKQHDNAVQSAAEAARLLKIKKRTPGQESELTKAKQAVYAIEENRKTIAEYRKKSVDEAVRLKAEKDAAAAKAAAEMKKPFLSKTFRR